MKLVLALATLFFGLSAHADGNRVLKCTTGDSLIIYDDTSEPVEVGLKRQEGGPIVSMQFWIAGGGPNGSIYKNRVFLGDFTLVGYPFKYIVRFEGKPELFCAE